MKITDLKAGAFSGAMYKHKFSDVSLSVCVCV